MPRGFNTPSGGSLSEEEQKVAMDVLSHLYFEREAGRVTPKQPRTGSEIAKLYNEKFGETRKEITDVHIRAYVNYLRAHAYPVCSCSRGYFYAITKSEVDESLTHLYDRKSALTDAIKGLEWSKSRLPA